MWIIVQIVVWFFVTIPCHNSPLMCHHTWSWWIQGQILHDLTVLQEIKVNVTSCNPQIDESLLWNMSLSTECAAALLSFRYASIEEKISSGCSELYRDQIFSQAINLYNKKFYWLFIVDPIWLVWNTCISRWLTHWLIHPPVHNILDVPTKR